MIDQLTGDPLVTAVAALVIVPLLVFLLTLGMIYMLRMMLAGSHEVESKEKLKYERYEAGNPPRVFDARGKVTMQYLGYLIMFLAVEPAVILLAVLLAAPRPLYWNLLILYVLLLAVYAPLIYYGVEASRRLEEWKI